MSELQKYRKVLKKRLGYSGINTGNVFAYFSTIPANLYKRDELIGCEMETEVAGAFYSFF
jgi:hypothetical protein